MEVSPRGGGNRLAEMVRFSTGADMITAAVRAAVGDSVSDLEQKPLNGHWAEIILHADKNGILEGIEISPVYKDKVQEVDLWYEVGQQVREFQSARDAIGTLVVRFETDDELEVAISQLRNWIHVITK